MRLMTVPMLSLFNVDVDVVVCWFGVALSRCNRLNLN